ncbi:lysylphosphatidylglycerol synthase transmembrane domain-containing protein [Propionivibrio sp.]|uniref:lysylphosphatidylglycerol synthase transmembrane domain-containing protein n=1 Tax=Propionivibrio sp. TaxID=2212460 RepID=UPI003BF30BBA
MPLKSFIAPKLPLRAVLWSVALAALGYLGLSLWAGWREVVAAVVQVGPFVIFGLLALSLSNYLLRFVRWGRYLALLEAPVAWRINLDVYFSGFALTTSPGKLGEMMRSVLLKPHGVPAAASIAAFFAERASDLLSILVLAAIGLWAYAPARPVVGLALGGVILSLVLVQWTALIAAIDRWAMVRTQKWAKLIVRLCEIILHFRRCFSLPAMSMGLLIGVVAWFAEGFGFWWLLSALGHPLPITTAVFIYAFAMLVGGLSFLPGGLGSSEAVMIGLLVLNGFPEPAAVTATLICRLATLWFAVGLGAVFLARQR